MSLSKLLCTVVCTFLISTGPLYAVEPTTFPGPKNNAPAMKKDAPPKQLKTKKTKTSEEVVTPQKEAPKKSKLTK